jgi:hypothetical protein
VHPLGGYPKSFEWRRTWIYYSGSARWEQMYLRWKTKWLQLEWVKNPKGFGFYL